MEIQTAYAGDIVSVAGFPGSTVAYTLNKLGNTDILPVNYYFDFSCADLFNYFKRVFPLILPLWLLILDPILLLLQEKMEVSN